MNVRKLLFSLFRSSLRILISLAILLPLLSWLPVEDGRAGALIQVNSTIDSLANDGSCTLREAVIAANKDQRSGSKNGECPAGSGADTIQLPSHLGNFILTRTDNGKEDASATGDLDIQSSVIIQASNPGVVVTVDSGFTDRIFHVLSGNVTLNGFTIQGGISILDGGGINNLANLRLEKMTLTSNQATGSGGGIHNAARGQLTLVNSTLSGNSSQAHGGGLNNAGSASLNNVTVTANIAGAGGGVGDGGGLASSGGSSLQVKNTIISGNQDSSGSPSAPDCSGMLVSGGHNLTGNMNGCTFTGDLTGNLMNLDPLLGSLTANGGFTQTHMLNTGSPAIDAGSPAVPGSGGSACEATDQRGAFRPRGAVCDIGAVEAGSTNTAVLIRAFTATVTATSVSVVGRLDSSANTTFSIQFYTGATCDPSGSGVTSLGTAIPINTDAAGNAYFSLAVPGGVTQGQFLWAVAKDPGGFASAPSRCVQIGTGNDSWPKALLVSPELSPNMTATIDQVIDLPGQSRWFKFKVEPGSKLQVTLTNLPANYDLTLYKDIRQAFTDLTSPQDLLRLGAEFAPEAFTPEAFTPEAFSPEMFSPEAFTPEAFSPEAFTPEAFTPEAFTPEAFTPEAFTPEAFTPDGYSPEAFSPEAFTPEAFTPEAFTPEAFTPEAFTSAQTRSLVGISAYNGLAGEGLRLNAWDNDGEFYVRVRGRNGAFDPLHTFHLEIQMTPGSCGGVTSQFPAPTLNANAGGYRTLILSDLARVEGTLAERDTLLQHIQQLAARPEVAGKIIDLGQDARVQAAIEQAETFYDCPYAKNLAAGTIKELVDAYWELNPSLEYLVLVGNDQAVPFYRHPDQSMLGNEKQYVPPVKDSTTSQASLRLGYVLSQDDYGARISVSMKDDSFPVPVLGVGRLVETASEATSMVDAYLSTANGVVNTPSSAFVSGYDFLVDAANAVLAELQAGLGATGNIEPLIAPQDAAPTDERSWSADQLRAGLLGQRHDLIFLAGHFSASGALAADYTTRMTTGDLLASNVDLLNALVYSAGCHSGYNIVNDHGVSLVTREPDWAQAFARKGATLIAGTGYQYGDTDFIRYSEKLYLEFTQALRKGSGPVSVGKALVQAKAAYLAGTPYLRGIDEKAVLEATLFGLPMLSIDLPGSRLPTGSDPSLVSNLAPVTTGPGAVLGLATFDLPVQPQLSQVNVPLRDIANGGTAQTTYFEGPDGVLPNTNEPALPLAIYNVSVPGQVLRGVGFRSGTYQDLLNVIPFTGATATEIRGVHAPFVSNYFFPTQTWRVNYFSALAGGNTHLALFPAQYQSSDPASISGTMRTFLAQTYRLFYSSNISTYNSSGTNSTPALAAAPAIVKVQSLEENGNVRFQLQVVGNPAAGMQAVWITYTGINGSLAGGWSSLDLTQNALNSTIWEGTLPLNGFPASQVRFFAQAVNGVGLVSMDTNQGSYYIPGITSGTGTATSLAFTANSQGEIPGSGKYGDPVTFSARLTSGGTGLAGKVVSFVLGPQSRIAVTDSNGTATVSLSIYGLAGSTEAKASFAGDSGYSPSQASQPFTINRQSTHITLSPDPASGYPEDTLLTATLQDAAGRFLSEETIFFILRRDSSTYYQAEITDYAGRAPLGPMSLPPGSYTVEVYFSGQVPLPETINLFDDRYEPAIQLDGALTITHRVPSAAADAYTTAEDELLSVAAPGVLENDSDPEGTSISAVLLTAPEHGQLTLNPDGSFTYLPETNYNGSDSFTYAANDGIDTSLPATVSLQITAVNDAPVATADQYTTAEDTPLTVLAPGVLGNDTDIDSSSISAVLNSGPASGMLALDPSGSFVYTPAPDFSGQVTFTYQVLDGSLLSQAAQVTITFTAVNDAPRCSAAAPSTSSLWPPNGGLTPVTVINITDPEGDPVSYTIDRVFQDEPVGSEPDAFIHGQTVELRNERDGNGNGRVYHIYFTASDSHDASCQSEVIVGVVPHDQGSDLPPIDGGPLYDSTSPQ